jgi:hypothetical protein
LISSRISRASIEASCFFSLEVHDEEVPPALATRHKAASAPAEEWEHGNMAIGPAVEKLTPSNQL